MKIRTKVKSGALTNNHNAKKVAPKKSAKDLLKPNRVKTAVRAGRAAEQLRK